MGLSQSHPAIPVEPVPAKDPTAKLSLNAPNAAVIGAGVAGVHVAYELAKIGFQVTVFEQNQNVAQGETRDTLPFVGVGLIEPSMTRTALRAEVLKGLLFPSTCPDVIVREHFFHSIFNPVVYRWLWGRLRSSFTGPEALAYTNNLSRLSVAVVRDLVKNHPPLQSHIIASPISVQGEDKLVAPTAHPEPMMVDPVGWTESLAAICAEKYGVRFAMGERVEETKTLLKYDVESMKSIRISKSDPENTDKRIFAEERYDVVVLTAGANTGTMTLPTTGIPVLGLTGWTALIRKPIGTLQESLNSILKPANTVPGTPVSSNLAVLKSSCSLYAYAWPSAARSSSAVEEEGLMDYVIQGLLSFDCTKKTHHHSLVTRQLKRLEGYLRTKCGLTLPLAASSTATSWTPVAEESQPDSAVVVREYIRAFTPDGVPIIDLNGGIFNSFVCCGFGDHAMDFAPGAARIMGKLTSYQAERLREADLEEVKAWGIAASKLTPSRKEIVEAELQQLCSENPSDLSGGGDLASPVAYPYSTNRFTGMIPREVKDITHRSPLWHFYDLEDRTVTRSEPYRKAFSRWAMKYARQDNVPDIIRTIIFYYIYVEDDDPAVQKAKATYEQRLYELARAHEIPPSDDVTVPSEEGVVIPMSASQRSRLNQERLEEETRQLFNR